MACPRGKEKRRTPRIEGLNCALVCIFDDKHTFTEAYLRDLSLDSLRFEMLQSFPEALGANGTHLRAHVPELELYLACESHVARTYEAEVAGRAGQGVALRFDDLDAVTRAQIRSLYPAQTDWPEPSH